ncbi:MAG TPA: hypothetical protein VF012_07660 [Nocardioidaceae bacterium]
MTEATLWFRCVVAGDGAAIEDLALTTDAWQVEATMSAEAVLGLYGLETACHAGHLDAARELIDGKNWLVLTE